MVRAVQRPFNPTVKQATLGDMTKSKDKLGYPSTSPLSFPRWQEVLQGEQLNPILTRLNEGEIVADLKCLKATRRRSPMESVGKPA